MYLKGGRGHTETAAPPRRRIPRPRLTTTSAAKNNKNGGYIFMSKESLQYGATGERISLQCHAEHLRLHN